MHELVRVPKPSREDEVADIIITSEEANEILDYLDTHEYASLRNVIFRVLWKTGMSRSSLYALDVDDIDEGSKPLLHLRHRTNTSTPLKNKRRGERDIRLDRETADVIADFLKHNHPGGTDEHGRTPILMSTPGKRCEPSTIQRNVYTVNRPCHYTGECPMDRELDECEATSCNTASKCPGSFGPHALRRGYVTEALNAGQPRDVNADRMDMTTDVWTLQPRDEEEQMET